MANLATVLKEEISRLARKEAKAQVEPIRSSLANLRQVVYAQKKEVAALEREVSRIVKKLGLEENLDLPPEEEVEKARITPKSIAALRAKYELSREQMAALMDVNANSIYLWEQGKSNPRKLAQAKIIALKKMGKRGVAKALEELGK